MCERGCRFCTNGSIRWAFLEICDDCRKNDNYLIHIAPNILYDNHSRVLGCIAAVNANDNYLGFIKSILEHSGSSDANNLINA